ncbi:hypothetical protein HK405_001622 [Cladochytrium tenue]|nr:hypothetical protein HK405_001622 [Cladochytrium tenue]
MPRLAAPLAITTVAITAVAAAASAALLLWTVRRTRGRDASAAASEASLPAGTASARERSRRLQRFGNDLPEADVPSLPLIGHARALAEVHAIFARIGTAFNFSFFSIDVLAVAGHENLRRVFSNMESFNSAYPARWLELFGPSAVTFIEKEHRRIRNILNAGISKTYALLKS